tara:strand:- start:492 stop:1340 length:849 start_codon:yes stop_codon:yes gene_type:complete
MAVGAILKALDVLAKGAQAANKIRRTAKQAGKKPDFTGKNDPFSPATPAQNAIVNLKNKVRAASDRVNPQTSARGNRPAQGAAAAARERNKLLRAGAGFGVAGYAGAKAIEATQNAVKRYLEKDTPNTETGVKEAIKKAKGLSKADADKLIGILGPEIKEAADKKRSDSFKPAPAGPRPEKELTFGQKFKQERAKAKKAGKELTATFTYKGKSYNTRIKSEEPTKVLKQEGTGKEKKGRVEVYAVENKSKKTTPKTKKANRGALVSRQRKGHTDMRKGGLFR